MRRPREPAPGECCGSGCTRCVWDIYYDELSKFEDFLANGGVEDDDSSSSEEEEVVSYVGSVVVKILDASEVPNDAVLGCDKWGEREMRRRGFVPIESVTLIKSSVPVFTPESPGVNVLRVGAQLGKVRALPGDAVEVLVPNNVGTNSADDVARLCKVLDLDLNTWCELRQSPFVPEDNFPPWLPLERPLTVGQLLLFYVDISSSSYLLHRTFFEGLLRIYNNNSRSSAGGEASPAPPDPEKVQLLKECASPETGPGLLRTVANRAAPLCYPSLVDVLETFSFVRVPLDRLLEVTGPLQPRKFSVASYLPSNAVSDHIELCMREVCAPRLRSLHASEAVGSARRVALMLNEIPHAVSPDGGSFFYGHTSHPLCEAARRSQQGTVAPLRSMYIGSSLFGTSTFAQQLQLGCSAACNPGRSRGPAASLFLVGCGTGIAPLIAAVAQLMERRAALPRDAAPFPCWVFYGGRTQAELVYHERLQEALSLGAIARYEYAISREPGAAPHGGHVTDLLSKHRAAITSALEDVGQMFVCGPANALRSIRTLLERDIFAEADDDDSVREQRILLLEERGRLSFDIWSTGSIF